MYKGIRVAPSFDDMAMELWAGHWKGESGAGLENERESEGIGGEARAEHLEVESAENREVEDED